MKNRLILRGYLREFINNQINVVQQEKEVENDDESNEEKEVE